MAVIVAKYGHTIVERNRLRRRLRELTRIRLIPSCIGTDLIVRALPGAYGVDFQQLGNEMDEIRKHVLMITPED